MILRSQPMTSPGWQVANDGPLTVALDVTITDELLAEGMARELVNRIQNIRKDKDFNVTDNIRIQLERDEGVVHAVEQFGDYIKAETLAVSLELVDPIEDGEELELPDDVKVNIKVEQV
jgi:isoleucyl-tRNA synthetase